MAQVLDVLDTPNPNALKFMTDAPLAHAEAVFVESPEEAGAHPLSKKLFALPGVASIFALNNFVTITRRPNTSWETLRPAVIDILREFTPIHQAPSTSPSEAAQDTLISRIEQVLDENVRPALAGDGGGVEVAGLKNFVLSVHYQGACGSCPSASSGTLFGIQALLQQKVDPRIQVLPL